MTLTVRPATAADFFALYGEKPDHTIKAEVVEADGRVLGIGGIAYSGERPLLFSKMLPELRRHKRFIVEAALHLAARAKAAHAVAVADPKEHCSVRLLTKLGLHKVADSAGGDVFGWPKP